MRWFLLLLILSTGCGWYPFPYKTGPYVAHSGCIEVHSDFEVNQAALDHDVDLARQMLDQRGLVRAADFCSEFQGVPIAISHNWNVSKDELGQYSVFRGILLGGGAGALLHEFVHEVDVTRDLNICSSAHCGWRTKGYLADDTNFFKRSQDLRDDSWNFPQDQLDSVVATTITNDEVIEQ